LLYAIPITAEELGAAEVGDLDICSARMSVMREQEVGTLEVSVDDGRPM